jgi:small basic protein
MGMQSMKAWLPVISLAGGYLFGSYMLGHSNVEVPAEYAVYLSVAALAGLDTVFGGIRAGIEGRFQNDIFASGFLLNTLLAAGLAWLGNRLGVSLALVAVLSMGQRVFLNLSLIRRYYLNKIALERSKLAGEADGTGTSPTPPRHTL